MTIKGEIRAREELVVDGEVDGTLESQSLITVGPSGKVHCNIKAREVIIFGSVRGNVDVSEKIAIREQGSLVGTDAIQVADVAPHGNTTFRIALKTPDAQYVTVREVHAN